VICKEFAFDRFFSSSIGVMTEDQTHGFELANEVILRSVISVEAIESLIEALVDSDENKKPSLWHWLYNPPVGCYIPISHVVQQTVERCVLIFEGSLVEIH
jgi:hypothetical protein